MTEAPQNLLLIALLIGTEEKGMLERPGLNKMFSKGSIFIIYKVSDSWEHHTLPTLLGGLRPCPVR